MGTHTHAYTYIGHTVPAVHLSRIGGAMLEQENGMRGPRSAEGSSKTGPPNYFLPKPFPHIFTTILRYGCATLDESMAALENSPYIAKCRRTLWELGAPLTGWRCVRVSDHESDDFTCELCGCTRVRYVHVMEHPEFSQMLSTGCICAGIMEEDILGAKEREREVRRRSQRKSNFLKKEWVEASEKRWVLRYKHRKLVIDTDSFRGREYYRLEIDGEGYHWKDNARMTSFLVAQHFAFDIMDGEYA